MRCRRWLGAILMATATASADAQGIGSLIRKKVDEAVKPKETAVRKEEAPTDGSTLGFVLDEQVLGAFKSALRVEVSMRDEFRQRLAKIKTPEEYDRCVNSLATSSELQKATADYTTAIGNAKTDDESQQATKSYYAKLEELKVNKCGDNPHRWNAQQQVQEFDRAEKAAIEEFVRGINRSPPDDDRDAASIDSVVTNDTCPYEQALESSDFATCTWNAPIASSDAASLVADTITYDKAQGRYRILVEWVEKFCSMSAAARDDAAKNGIRIPGTGKNIFWVYTAREAQWLNKDFAELGKLLAARQ